MTAANLRQQLGVGLREQLGAILVRRGRMSRDALQEALEASEPGERLGETLLRLNLIYEEDLATALADQFGIRYMRIEALSLDPEPASLLPEATARELEAVPLRVSGDRVCIAVADPTNIVAADSLRMAVDLEVELVVSERSSVRAAIDQVYAQVEQLDAPVAPRLEVVTIDAEGDRAPAVETVHGILRRAVDLHASDIHFVPTANGLLVRARVDGVLRELQTVPADRQDAVTARLKVMGQLDIAERRLPQDGRVSIVFADMELDMRLAVLPTGWGEEIALRVHYPADSGPRTFAELGMDDGTAALVESALRQPSGALIVCGPTGSGKTTTLYAALGLLNDGTRSIITIEDPVEAPLEGVVQVPVNPRIGLTFARGLRTILRADPDVILIGEIRDHETAEIAMQAALTGHLVLSTLHAESASAAVTRLTGMGVTTDVMGSALRCVASQRLVRRLCTGCARSAPKETGIGCASCGWSGYAGRTGVYEAVAVGETGLKPGGTTFAETARVLVERGVTRYDEVERVCGTAVLGQPA
jgi:type II secretory ATPase GspE/PulE/Tfp pilus assembly ATPase PilB-like protein